MARFIFLIFVTASVASGGEAPLAFDSAVEIALARAPQITATSAARESAQSLETSAGRFNDPAVIVGVDNVPVTGPDAFSTTTDPMSMRRIGLMQSFKPAGMRAGERHRAASETEFADAELKATRLDVARASALAWIRYAASHAALEDLRKLEGDVELGATAARAGLRSGRGSAAEALNAEAAVTRLKGRILELQGELRRSEAELSRWIGADSLGPPGPMPSMDQLPASVESLRGSAHLHDIVRSLDARVEIAQADLELARAARRPGWSAELMYGKRGPTFDDMASLLFTVDLPLFARTRQNPVIAARSADLRRAEAERDTAIAMHEAELDQALASWEELGARLKFFEREQLPLARERSRAALAAYRGAQSDLRSAIEAFQDETELLVERAQLTGERGAAWTYLRYLERAGLPEGTP
jgi:cobalt-zinc-cadmium efflux system outer membrane protein